MSLADQLESWRDTFDHPPSDEEMLRQFLYSGIIDFVSESWENLYEALTDPNADLDGFTSAWVDKYADG